MGRAERHPDMATLIVMPRLSPTMEEGLLAKWTKKEGDKIAPGDIIAEVETDKANMDFPLEDEGVLLKQLAKAGDTVRLGAPVAILGDAGEDISALLVEAAQAGGGAAAPAPVASTSGTTPITKASDGSHAPARSRKPCTLPGSVMPDSNRPRPNNRPTANAAMVCFACITPLLTTRAAARRRSENPRP